MRASSTIFRQLTAESGIGGHDPNSKDKDELGHVSSFLPAYSLCNSDSNSISVNSYPIFYQKKRDRIFLPLFLIHLYRESDTFSKNNLPQPVVL